MKLSEKILNHLRYAKSSEGKVGCRVQPTGDFPNNQAWITIVMRKGSDFSTGIHKEYFIAYEIEYVELDENYNEEENGLDYDLFTVRTERFLNIKTVEQLEKTLLKWIGDLSVIEPVAGIGHPYC